MKISFFPEITNNEPVPLEITWDGFVESLKKHTFTYTDKLKVPAFSPAEYPDGARRARANVKCVHFGVLDLDKLTDAQMDVLRGKLDGTEYVYYTTWSHQKNFPLWCGRLIVPFSRPVLLSEWDLFWPRLNRRFGGLGDSACKDPSRLYFYPAAPDGTQGMEIFDHQVEQ